MKRVSSIGFGYASALGCAVLLACSNSMTSGQQAPGGASGGTTTSVSGSTGASSGDTTSASGSTSGANTTSGPNTASGSNAASGSNTASGSSATSGSSTTSDGGNASGVSSGGQAGMDAAAVGSDGGADSGFSPIIECTKPSVDRLEVWTSSGPAEGTTIPPTGDLLVMEGGRYVAKVQFLNVEWHVCPVYLGNQFNANAKLSASSGFLLTYSSTSDMYVQARPTSHWSGGTQWATKIPSTGGVKKSQFFSFDPVNWKSLFGTPTWSFADTLKEVLGFVFVGQTPNIITFYGLRFDGYVPPCP
jgi:hypothetical protein